MAENLKKDPKAGKATFYSDTQWTGGMKSLTNFSAYKIDGNMKKSKERKFTLYGDEMLELGGTDTVPGAIEEMMYAVGTCIVAAANANAAVMGVKLTRRENIAQKSRKFQMFNDKIFGPTKALSGTLFEGAITFYRFPRVALRSTLRSAELTQGYPP